MFKKKIFTSRVVKIVSDIKHPLAFYAYKIVFKKLIYRIPNKTYNNS